MNALTDITPFSEAERRWNELKTARAGHEQDWADIARLLRPQRKGFSADKSPDQLQEKPLSSLPIMAQENFSAGLYGTLTNPANKWFAFDTGDKTRDNWHENRTWLDLVTNIVLRSFQPTVSPFYNSAHQLFGDLSSFGNGAHYDELVPAEKKILDVTVNLSEIVVDIDGFGRVSEAVRKFRMKARAAVSMFGADAVPPKVIEMAEKGDQALITFYHHVLRNVAFRKGKLGPAGKEWSSTYSCEIARATVRQAGYAEMPFFVARWSVDTGDTWGTGPGFIALANTRVHAQMTAAALRRAQKEADPTLLAPDKGDWPLNGRIRPGAVLYGGTNIQGNQMVRPLEIGGNFSLTLEERQHVEEQIKDAFHYSLMNLAGRTGMTATEIMTITEERQRLWAPHQGRVQEEFLAPKIARRFALLWRAGQIPPPPQGLAGAELRITYLSAAAAAQRSTEGNAALRVLQDVAPLLQLKPRLADRIDDDGLLEVLVEARGAPARMIRSREAANQIGQQRDQAMQASQMAQLAQQGAGAVKDIAGAQAAMQGQGGR